MSFIDRLFDWTLEEIVIEDDGEQRHNPYHDELGKFTTGDGGVGTEDHPHVVALKHRAALKTVAARAATAVKLPDGGFTLHENLSTDAEKGYFVSVAGHEQQVPATHMTDEKILEYRDAKHHVLKLDPSLRIGGWHNGKDSRVYLDLSKRFKTKLEAIDFGIKHGQIAGYDSFLGESFHIGARSSVYTPLGLTLAQEFKRQAAMHGNPLPAKTLRLAPTKSELAAMTAPTIYDLATVTKDTTVYRGLDADNPQGLTGLSFIDMDRVVTTKDQTRIEQGVILDIVIPAGTEVGSNKDEIALPYGGTFTLGAHSVDDVGRHHYAVRWE